MRYRTVIDMHFVNRMQAYGWPLLVMVIALVIVLSIGAIVGTQGAEVRAEMYEGMTWSGAIFSLLGPLIGYGFVSMGQYFPLALGLGVTRREFAAGQSLLFLGNALAYALLVTLGKTVEAATGGFGLGIRFFDVFYTGTGASWQTFVQTFLLIVAILFLGAAITSAFLRFGQPILWISGSLWGSSGGDRGRHRPGGRLRRATAGAAHAQLGLVDGRDRRGRPGCGGHLGAAGATDAGALSLPGSR